MSETTVHKPGDVVNGHVLTTDNVWVPLGASAESSAVEPQPRKKRGKKLLIGVGAVAAGVIVIGVLATAGGSDETTTASTDSAVEADAAGQAEPATEAEQPEAPTLALEDFKALTADEWALIAKDPDAATGQAVVVFAEVTQFDSATGTETFRANAGATQPTGEYELETNTVFTGDEGALSAVTQGDVLKVYAVVDGSLDYETQIGGETTVPQLSVQQIENVGFADITGDAVLGQATWDEYLGAEIPVTITNSGDKTYTYSVDVVAESPDGSTLYETGSAYVDNLAPGQSAQESATFFDDVPTDAVFKVVNVERY